MTDIRTSVRAACDAVARGKCKWPACQCFHLKEAAADILTALLSAAEARGAEKEREECAALADELITYRSEDRLYGRHVVTTIKRKRYPEEIAAAIRNRKAPA